MAAEDLIFIEQFQYLLNLPKSFLSIICIRKHEKGINSKTVRSNKISSNKIGEEFGQKVLYKSS